MKKAYIAINFHAHEPVWGMHPHLLRMTGDVQLSKMLPTHDYFKERMDSGNDLYSHSIDIATQLNIPFGLEISNELIQQLKSYKQTIKKLRKAFRDKVFYPILGHAHHTHVEFLSNQELVQEITRNRQALKDVFDVEVAAPAGYFPSECSLEERVVPALNQAAIDYVIFPHIEKQEPLIEVQNGGIEDVFYKPFYIEGGGVNILALPRNFAISQEIWRPLTKLVPEKAKKQGYCLGRFPVLDEEFETGKAVKFPISFEDAVEEYLFFLRKAVAECPNEGLLLFIQDLELMGVGEEMFSVLKQAFDAIREEQHTEVIFTSLSQYLADYQKNHNRDLPKVKFKRICWAPEIHAQLRVDGLYLPLGVKEYHGVNGSKIYLEDPFVFWTPGSHIISIFSQILEAVSSDKNATFDATGLLKADYEISKFGSEEDKILFLHLLQKRADNWGWRPDEERQKWCFLYGFLIISLLERKFSEEASQFRGFEDEDVHTLIVYPKLFLEARIRQLAEAITRLSKEMDMSNARTKLELANYLTEKVYADIENLQSQNRFLRMGNSRAFQGIVLFLKKLCKDFCLATNMIQQVWVASKKTESVLVEVYKIRHQLYPPSYPSIVKKVKRGKNEQFTSRNDVGVFSA